MAAVVGMCEIIRGSVATSRRGVPRFLVNTKKYHGRHRKSRSSNYQVTLVHSFNFDRLQLGNCSIVRNSCDDDDGVTRAEGDANGMRVSLIEDVGERGGAEFSQSPSSDAAATEAMQQNVSKFLDAKFCKKLVTMARNADEALEMISSQNSGGARVVSSQECCELIVAAIAQGNADLAFSVLNSMCRRPLSKFQSDQGASGSPDSWQWPQPDVSTYATMIKALAASLRVSDAIQTVSDVQRRGVPPGDEVPFGKVVKCPTCKVALAVVQPQCGIQLVACSRCRYQYELMSGDIVSCESESISSNFSAFERGLRFLQLIKRPVPSAIHSVVVKAPDGVARTHRFATESAEVPGQVGERVTVALAAPARQGLGFISFAARTPGWQPSEPMAITNHVTGREISLLRAPPKSGSGAAFDTSVIFPAAVILASSNAATAFIDPTLPRGLAVGAAAAIVVGGAANAFVLPRLNQIPSRTADAIALRQELLSQYELLQARLQQLTKSTVEEVRRLARMCQLQNKMESVGQAMYRARIERVRKARKGIDERLSAQLELIDSYAKIASMIEIEVEMDMDVIAAETAGAVASIEEQIQRLMEIEELQKKWSIQAEAADEVEKLLSSAPFISDTA